MDCDDGSPFTLGAKLSGGDFRKVGYVDRTPELGTARGLFNDGEFRSGRALRPDNMPTSYWQAGRPFYLRDFVNACGLFILVSGKVRGLIEEQEPGLHQFFPVEVTVTRKKVPVDPMYILNICTRLDAVNRTATTKPFVRNRAWTLGDPGEIVFDLAKIGESKMWHDRHIYDVLFISDELKEVFVAAGLTGLVFRSHPAA